jgi:hypothetical protein
MATWTFAVSSDVLTGSRADCDDDVRKSASRRSPLIFLAITNPFGASAQG